MTRPPGAWAGVVALGIGIFSIATSQFLPAGLLPLMAADLDVSVGVAGQSFTATALAAGPSALQIAVVLPRTDRRRVMIGLTLLAVTSDLLVALAPGVLVLLVGRLLLGVALGGFWSLGIAVTAHLVPVDRLGRALTVVNAGVPVATGVAVPLGAWVGDAWGWRAVFLLGAGVAAVALALQVVSLPPVPPGPTGGLRALGSTLRSGMVQLGMLATVLVYAGHFAGFTYIRPLAEAAAGLDARGVAALLLVFGCANLAGTVLAGQAADRAPRLGVLLFPSAVGTGMLLLLGVGGSVPALFTAATLWGLGFGGVATSLQSWGARVQPARLEQIGGVLVTAANTAVAVGAVAGGLLVGGAAGAPPLLGGIAALAGGLLIASLRQR
ncbi:MFS transporter [Pseudonocardia xishanensis]|uniref:MFS transporter n=1 Tax=Pseudonocardia xishanensis TaxID=630995 RepID=A0ABP8RT05_9PSEU